MAVQFGARFITPLTHCSCGGRLLEAGPPVEARCLDLGGEVAVLHQRVRCQRRACRTVHAYNFVQTSAQGPQHPTLSANLFPKVTDQFRRLPLPSLSHEPKAVNLGDLMRLWVRARVQINTRSWLFKDS